MVRVNTTNKIGRPVRIYDRAYLEAFARSINKYKKTETLLDGKIAEVFDWDEIYFKAGVKSKNGGLIWYLDSNNQKCFLLEKFDEIYRQWQYMRDGRNYAEEKRLEQLAILSQQEIESQELFDKY